MLTWAEADELTWTAGAPSVELSGLPADAGLTDATTGRVLAVCESKRVTTTTWVQLAVVEGDGIYRRVSSDSGATWGAWSRTINLSALSGWTKHRCTFHTVDGSDLVWLLIPHEGVYRSSNKGNTWTLVWSGATAGDRWEGHMVVDPATPTTLWVSLGEGLWRLTDADATVSAAKVTGTGLTATSSTGAVAQAGGRLFVLRQPDDTDGPAVLFSDDSGTTWTDANVDADHISTFALDAAALSATSLLVATDGAGVTAIVWSPTTARLVWQNGAWIEAAARIWRNGAWVDIPHVWTFDNDQWKDGAVTRDAVVDNDPDPELPEPEPDPDPPNPIGSGTMLSDFPFPVTAIAGIHYERGSTFAWTNTTAARNTDALDPMTRAASKVMARVYRDSVDSSGRRTDLAPYGDSDLDPTSGKYVRVSEFPTNLANPYGHPTTRVMGGRIGILPENDPLNPPGGHKGTRSGPSHHVRCDHPSWYDPVVDGPFPQKVKIHWLVGLDGDWYDEKGCKDFGWAHTHADEVGVANPAGGSFPGMSRTTQAWKNFTVAELVGRGNAPKGRGTQMGGGTAGDSRTHHRFWINGKRSHANSSRGNRKADLRIYTAPMATGPLDWFTPDYAAVIGGANGHDFNDWLAATSKSAVENKIPGYRGSLPRCRINYERMNSGGLKIIEWTLDLRWGPDGGPDGEAPGSYVGFELDVWHHVEALITPNTVVDTADFTASNIADILGDGAASYFSESHCTNVRAAATAFGWPQLPVNDGRLDLWMDGFQMQSFTQWAWHSGATPSHAAAVPSVIRHGGHVGGGNKVAQKTMHWGASWIEAA